MQRQSVVWCEDSGQKLHSAIYMYRYIYVYICIAGRSRGPRIAKFGSASPWGSHSLLVQRVERKLRIRRVHLHVHRVERLRARTGGHRQAGNRIRAQRMQTPAGLAHRGELVEVELAGTVGVAADEELHRADVRPADVAGNIEY